METKRYLDQRREYERDSLLEETAGLEPFVLFARWFKEALEAGVPHANAMTLATVSPDGKALSFLSSETSTGQVFYSTEGGILWDHWVVYYQRGQELIRRDVPWTAPPAGRQTPQPVQNVVGPLAAFLDGQGRILTQNLESFSVTNIKDTRLFRVSIEVQGNQNIQPISIQSTIRPRN